MSVALAEFGVVLSAVVALVGLAILVDLGVDQLMTFLARRQQAADRERDG